MTVYIDAIINKLSISSKFAYLLLNCMDNNKKEANFYFNGYTSNVKFCDLEQTPKICFTFKGQNNDQVMMIIILLLKDCEQDLISIWARAKNPVEYDEMKSFIRGVFRGLFSANFDNDYIMQHIEVFNFTAKANEILDMLSTV